MIVHKSRSRISKGVQTAPHDTNWAMWCKQIYILEPTYMSWNWKDVNCTACLRAYVMLDR